MTATGGVQDPAADAPPPRTAGHGPSPTASLRRCRGHLPARRRSRRARSVGDPSACRAARATDRGGARTRVDLPGGTTLFERDDPGDSLYIIVRGRLRVIVEDDHGEALLRELGPDQTVGEMALLTGEPRKGTVIAVRDRSLFRLGREDFERCASQPPGGDPHDAHDAGQRLGRPPTRGRATAVPTVIAVVPAGHDAPVDEFATRLHRFLAGWTEASIVSARSIEDAIGPGAADAEAGSLLASRVHDHLARLERTSRHVIHVAEDVSSPWSMKCARQADLVLLVGRAGSSPGRNELERRLFDPDAPGQPGPAAARARRAGGEDDPDGHGGVVARASSRAVPPRPPRVAVALRPVGSVRRRRAGRARPERRRRPRRSPTSASCGCWPKRPSRSTSSRRRAPARSSAASSRWAGTRSGSSGPAREVFGGGRRKLLDFVPPFTSLIGSGRFNAVLDEIFADVRFEDLWIQFMCTTTDLTSARSRSSIASAGSDRSSGRAARCRSCSHPSSTRVTCSPTAAS